MQRCLQLAALSAGNVAPNPMVGAVLVYDDRIIGEGYHIQYGQAHAEVNCVNSVAATDRELIPGSTMYVSLEPCAHFGKTPPCADLIIRHQIKKVFVGCRDPFEAVNGKGIEKLKAAGVAVETGILEKECMELNKAFFTFHTKQRPYIILKWAQSANGFIGAKHQQNAGERVFITNEITNRLVHKWRSEIASILVGTETALMDDPSLTTRLWKGKNPLRLVIDRSGRLPATLKIFDRSAPTIIFNDLQSSEEEGLLYYDLEGTDSLLQTVCDVLYQKNINSVLVEGGARLLQSFIDADLWDEARIITNKSLLLQDGVGAPVLGAGTIIKRAHYLDDEVVVVMRGALVP
ncbi:bifunctional diaminohydroxyphosphoribosylaminopyrimidine deaminase/5-amino-6-(5-phosphoribosylamino)uracil reductase RibD [soil metagenome]